MRHIKIIAILFLLVVFTIPCLLIEQSSAGSPQKIKLTFMQPWAPSTNWAPFWSAQRRYWPEENIEAEVLDSKGSALTVQSVASGSVQAGFAGCEALKGIQEGMPIKIIAVGLQNDGSGILALKSSGITTLKDFEGKRISQFPFGVITRELPRAMLKRQGVNLEKVKFINMTPGNEMKLLLAGSIDAAVVKLGVQNLHLYCSGHECVEFPSLQYGVNIYEMFVIVNTKWEEEIGYDGMVRFLRGVAKGFLLRKTNSAQTVEDMIYYREMEKPFKKRYMAEFWLSLPRLMSPDVDKYGWGVVTEEKMKTTQDFLFEIGFLDKKFDTKKYYDDRYLKDPSIQKIAMEFARVPIDPKAEGYLKACREH